MKGDMDDMVVIYQNLGVAVLPVLTVGNGGDHFNFDLSHGLVVVVVVVGDGVRLAPILLLALIRCSGWLVVIGAPPPCL